MDEEKEDRVTDRKRVGLELLVSVVMKSFPEKVAFEQRSKRVKKRAK